MRSDWAGRRFRVADACQLQASDGTFYQPHDDDPGSTHFQVTGSALAGVTDFTMAWSDVERPTLDVPEPVIAEIWGHKVTTLLAAGRRYHCDSNPVSIALQDRTGLTYGYAFVFITILLSIYSVMVWVKVE